MQPHRWWRNHSLASVKSKNTSSCFGINLYSSDLRFQVSFAISTSCLDEIPAGSPAEYQDFDSSIRRCCVQFPLTSTQPRRAFESNFIYTPKIQRISFRAFFKAKSLLRFGKLCKIGVDRTRLAPIPGICRPFHSGVGPDIRNSPIPHRLPCIPKFLGRPVHVKSCQISLFRPAG